MTNGELQKMVFGFTIIEVVVALAIFSVGVLGVVPLFSQSIKFSSSNSYQLRASMLAQEGLELARNARDNEWLKAGGGTFVNCFGMAFDAGDVKFLVFKKEGGVPVDLGVSNPTAAFNKDETKILINNGNSYESTNGIDSSFRRALKIIASAPNYYTVESTVRWTDRGVSHDYTASTELYNWR